MNYTYGYIQNSSLAQLFFLLNGILFSLFFTFLFYVLYLKKKEQRLNILPVVSLSLLLWGFHAFLVNLLWIR